MRSQIKSICLQVLFIPMFCFATSSAFALSGGFGTTTSGGGSSGSSVTGCSSIGGATAGSSLSGGFINTSGSGGETCSGEDSDADHMGNTWELTYSLNKDLATDAYGDADGDGSSNVREAYMGTIPSGTGTPCPGFSTTTVTDADCDGIKDGDDPAPGNASITILTVNGTYKGGKLTNTTAAP